jgi:hypothetical protein
MSAFMFRCAFAIAGIFLAVSVPVQAQQPPAPSVSFIESMDMLASACARDIDTHCAGVNLGSNRLKNCLSRNQATLTVACRDTYGKVFSQIDRRAQTRIGFLKHCEADAKKLCTASQKDDGAVIECLLSAKRLGWRCNMAVTEANFR